MAGGRLKQVESLAKTPPHLPTPKVGWASAHQCNANLKRAAMNAQMTKSLHISLAGEGGLKHSRRLFL
jgi:hypothetical protein